MILAAIQGEEAYQCPLLPLHSPACDPEGNRTVVSSTSDCQNICKKAADLKMVKNGFKNTVETFLR